VPPVSPPQPCPHQNATGAWGPNPAKQLEPSTKPRICPSAWLALTHGRALEVPAGRRAVDLLPAAPAVARQVGGLEPLPAPGSCPQPRNSQPPGAAASVPGQVPLHGAGTDRQRAKPFTGPASSKGFPVSCHGEHVADVTGHDELRGPDSRASRIRDRPPVVRAGRRRVDPETACSAAGPAPAGDREHPVSGCGEACTGPPGALIFRQLAPPYHAIEVRTGTVHGPAGG
jgi:hypothetical protein